MLHRQIDLPAIPRRIVSLVPSQTELLVDLGLQNNIVGVTKFCVLPTEIRKKAAVVGGTKKVHYDRISDLNPDLIICNKEENTKEMVRQLEKIAPVWISDIYTIEDNLKMIEAFGLLFDVQNAASKLSENIRRSLADFKIFMRAKPMRKVAYLIWKNPYMAAGTNTFIDHLLALNKFENYFNQAASRYPEIQLDMLRDVDKVLLSSEPYPFQQADVDAIKKTLQKEVCMVDGEFFSWYGSRLEKAFDYFKTLH